MDKCEPGQKQYECTLCGFVSDHKGAYAHFILDCQKPEREKGSKVRN